MSLAADGRRSPKLAALMRSAGQAGVDHRLQHGDRAGRGRAPSCWGTGRWRWARCRCGPRPGSCAWGSRPAPGPPRRCAALPSFESVAEPEAKRMSVASTTTMRPVDDRHLELAGVDQRLELREQLLELGDARLGLGAPLLELGRARASSPPPTPAAWSCPCSPRPSRPSAGRCGWFESATFSCSSASAASRLLPAALSAGSSASRLAQRLVALGQLSGRLVVLRFERVVGRLGDAAGASTSGSRGIDRMGRVFYQTGAQSPARDRCSHRGAGRLEDATWTHSSASRSCSTTSRRESASPRRWCWASSR